MSEATEPQNAAAQSAPKDPSPAESFQAEKDVVAPTPEDDDDDDDFDVEAALEEAGLEPRGPKTTTTASAPGGKKRPVG